MNLAVLEAVWRPVAPVMVSLLVIQSAFAQTQNRQAPPRNPRAGGIVTGQVTASGQPAVNAIVTVLGQGKALDGGRRVAPINVRLFATTNRTGRYQLTNVPAGSYYIVALPALAPGATSRAGHAITYYPGALNDSEARLVVLDGREPAEVDISLVRASLYTVSGVAMGSNGRLLTGGILQLGNGAPLFGIGGGAVPIASDGSFRTPALAPGSYSLQTSDGLGARAMSGVDTPAMSGARVTIRDRDITDVRLEPIRMVRVAGRIISGAGTARRALTVGTTPVVSEGPAGPGRPGVVRDDLTFELRTWPGRNVVRVFAADAPATPPSARGGGPIPATVRHQGVDVTISGIVFAPGRDVSGLVIELAH